VAEEEEWLYYGSSGGEVRGGGGVVELKRWRRFQKRYFPTIHYIIRCFIFSLQ